MSGAVLQFAGAVGSRLAALCAALAGPWARLASPALCLSVLVVLAGCGGSSGSEDSQITGDSDSADADYVAKYPMLAKYAGWENADFKRILEYDDMSGYSTSVNKTTKSSNRSSTLYLSGGQDITRDSVVHMVIGAKFSRQASQYANIVPFNIGAMKDNLIGPSLVDEDFSGSQASFWKEVVDKSRTDTNSDVMNLDFGGSMKICGFKSSLSYHQNNKHMVTSSNAGSEVVMCQSNSGNSITISVQDGSDYTPFLVGSAYSQDEIDSLVRVVTGEGNYGDTFIRKVICKNDGIPSDTLNVYGWMQLLSTMENVYGDLKDQYELYEGDGDSFEIGTLTALGKLKDSIENNIKTFYTTWGDSFVSKVDCMNYAVGRGDLSLSSEVGARSSEYAGRISASYKALFAGGSAEGSGSYAQEHGWGQAFQNVTIESECRPAGAVSDLDTWTSQLESSLKNLQQTVPTCSSLPATGSAIVPSAAETKDPISPPDSCFRSYADWKSYQDDQKKEKTQDVKHIVQAAQDVDDVGVLGFRQAIDEGTLLRSSQFEKTSGSAVEISTKDSEDPDYAQFMTEYHEVRSLAPTTMTMTTAAQVSSAQSASGNLVRLDNMFVSGFEVTPYINVLPQLRPDLRVDSYTKTALQDGYPNISLALTINQRLGQLDSYLAFLAVNQDVSGISSDMADNYHKFYQWFSDACFDAISAFAETGKDMPLNFIAEQMQLAIAVDEDGNALPQGKLYEFYGKTLDFPSFIVKLLQPDMAKIWAEGPGGYIPVRAVRSFQGKPITHAPELMMVTGIGANMLGSNSLSVIQKQVWTSPADDPMTLYDSNYANTPWFPIFTYYVGGVQPGLSFLTYIGSYRVLVGRVRQAIPELQNGESISADSLAVNNTSLSLGGVLGSCESWITRGVSPMTWKYSLYFPSSLGYDYKDYNVLMLSTQGTPTEQHQNGYLLSGSSLGLVGWLGASLDGDSSMLMHDNETGEVVTVPTYPSGQFGQGVALLPINEVTSKRFNSAFSYSTGLGLSDSVTGTSFSGFYQKQLMDAMTSSLSE